MFKNYIILTKINRLSNFTQTKIDSNKLYFLQKQFYLECNAVLLKLILGKKTN